MKSHQQKKNTLLWTNSYSPGPDCKTSMGSMKKLKCSNGALSLEEIVDECSKNADSQDSVNESIDIDEEEADPVEPPVKYSERPETAEKLDQIPG
uniref:Uncharacterized protein n=1 Tax=Ditylenchus dipsaci TaxID=166011 RepID=A0A915D5R7_9BILA